MVCISGTWLAREPMKANVVLVFACVLGSQAVLLCCYATPRLAWNAIGELRSVSGLVAMWRPVGHLFASVLIAAQYSVFETMAPTLGMQWTALGGLVSGVGAACFDVDVAWYEHFAFVASYIVCMCVYGHGSGGEPFVWIMDAACTAFVLWCCFNQHGWNTGHTLVELLYGLALYGMTLQQAVACLSVEKA